MNKGDALPGGDHVLRYVGGTHIDGDEINGSAFLRREGEVALSVNWLEFFAGSFDESVDRIRACSRLIYGVRARLARLNVRHSILHVFQNDPSSRQIAFLYDPLEEDVARNYREDLSHALIANVPNLDDPEAELIGDLLAQCIVGTFPAKKPA
jgi:hypothetical protein